MNQTEGFAHALALGKLLGNLLSLEMAARMAILKLDTRAANLITQLSQVREGEWVETNALTNRSDLRQTLEKYNKHASSDCKIDVAPIVRLRDALAHGRMFGFGAETRPHLRLLKF